MACHNVAYIEKMLRQGKTPAELGGKPIGQGVCKTAYLFNDALVVKLNAQAGFAAAQQKNPPRWIRLYGARGPRTYKAGSYILQEYVMPFRELPADHEHYDSAHKTLMILQRMAGKHGSGHDIHGGNIGVDKNGVVVVFDW